MNRVARDISSRLTILERIVSCCRSVTLAAIKLGVLGNLLFIGVIAILWPLSYTKNVKELVWGSIQKTYFMRTRNYGVQAQWYWSKHTQLEMVASNGDLHIYLDRRFDYALQTKQWQRQSFKWFRFGRTMGEGQSGRDTPAMWGFPEDGFPYHYSQIRRHIICPFWMVFTLSAVVPALVIRAAVRRRWRRRRRGHCVSCGYDLTGNTSGVCPECGQAIQSGVQHP